jgi:hypothetical protein
MTFTPQIDTFRIGDTFCIQSIIQDMLLDTFSKQDIEVSGFDFGIVCDIIRHDQSGYISAEQEFDFIGIVGEFSLIPIAENVIRSLILYEQDSLKRCFDGCFLPKQQGLYEVVFYHLGYAGKPIVNSDCKETVDIHVKMNQQMNNNYELLKTSPLKIESEEIYNRWGGYTFVVIE